MATAATNNKAMTLNLTSTISTSGSPDASPILPKRRRFFDESWNDSSNVSSAGESPSPARRVTSRRIKKDALWKAIEPAYQYLMDEEIMETCKSTESDLSWDDDDLTINTKVSLAEFMQQYKELTDWLSQLHGVTQRQGMSLSERYLNQSYHEEMLQRSPRRNFFNDYAKQLLRRYPNMKEEISIRMQHVNKQWEDLECAICPDSSTESGCVLTDLEADLNTLRLWLDDKEAVLLPQGINPEWTIEQIEDKLCHHLLLQRDIESHSKIVSAVLKLSERLQCEDTQEVTNASQLQVTAQQLERRWHGVWLQSLEWQCRLEEAISKIKAGIPLAGAVAAADWDDGYLLDEFDDSTDVCEDVYSDVIPFDEDEYEKITSDTDADTRGGGGVVGIEIPRPARRVDRDVTEKNTPDTGFDEYIAAARLLNSDECLNDGEKMWPSTTTRQNFDGENTTNETIKRKGKTECTDVGYGSESLSNDEQDGKKVGDSPPSSPKSDRGAKRKSTGEFVQVVGAAPTSSEKLESPTDDKPLDPSWRYSVTSAYDSSSNCSELPLTVEDTTAITTPERPNTLALPDDEPLPNIGFVNASPDEIFYRVTTVESELSDDNRTTENPVRNLSYRDEQTDNEKVEAMKDSRNGIAPVLNGFTTTLENDVREEKEDHSNANVSTDYHPRTRVDIIMTELDHLDNDISSVSRPRQYFSNLTTYNEPELRSVYTRQWMESSHSTWRDKAFKRLEQSAEEPLMSSSPTKTDRLRQLISQAESLAKEAEYWEEKNDRIDEKLAEMNALKTSALSSFTTSTDGSMPDESFSCDASSELTESDDEYSSAHSVPDLTNESNQTLHSNTSTTTLRSPLTPSNTVDSGGVVLRRNAPKKDRPRSVDATRAASALQEFERMPISISEGAIDPDMFKTMQKLDFASNQVTSSANDSKIDSTTRTRKLRSRRMKRSQSESERMTSSPAGARRFNFDVRKDATPSTTNSSSERTVNVAPGTESSTDVTEMISEERNPIDDDVITPVIPELQYSAIHDSYDSEECMNSTIESFSETAWDNYQDLPYQTISEGGIEEKLDDSHLQWEVSAIEDDLSSTGDWPRLKRPSVIKVEPMQVVHMDSDSDLEDLHDVIQESTHQLQVTGASLRKPRNDVMNTGIFLQPQKYAEIIATCETNVRCLEQVRSTIAETEHSVQLSTDDVISIQNTLTQWQAFHALAVQRQKEAEKLNEIYQEMVNIRSTVIGAEDALTWNQFEDCNQLENVIKHLQDCKLDLEQSNDKVFTMKTTLQDFTSERKHINVSTFDEEQTKLRCHILTVHDRLSAQISELQALLVCWHDYNEINKELRYCLGKEHNVLKCLEMTMEMVELTVEARLELVQDLQAMSEEFKLYEQKLSTMVENSRRILDKCYGDQAEQIRADIGKTASELDSLERRCQDDIHQCKNNERNQRGSLIDVDDVDDAERMEVDAAIHDASTCSSATQTSIGDVSDSNEFSKRRQNRHSFVRKLLQWAIPLQIACVIVYGLLCLSERSSHGILVVPHLRYVRGPPPV
ncbi:uncharacterized protein LOC141915384 isoform X2 [Tubulanus polymorphus]|uniref:uncharacterized protein LOC141915384 isoform X2 n=1 Tax=Tubulanus polymorphus TaxID=672921 RepID=UPI003DA58774